MSKIVYSPENFLTGARCVLKMRGKIIGFAFGISYQIRIEQRPNFVIDSIYPVEIYPWRVNVNGQVFNFRLMGLSATKMRLQPTYDNVLISKYVTIEIYNKDTDVPNNLSPIITFDKAMIVDRSESYSSESVVQTSLTFTSIGWSDADTKFIKGFEYDESKLSQINQMLRPYENEVYVPQVANNVISGAQNIVNKISSVSSIAGATGFISGNSLASFNNKLDKANQYIGYATKAVEVASYLTMDWEEDEKIINQVKNIK